MIKCIFVCPPNRGCVRFNKNQFTSISRLLLLDIFESCILCVVHIRFFVFLQTGLRNSVCAEVHRNCFIWNTQFFRSFISNRKLLTHRESARKLFRTATAIAKIRAPALVKCAENVEHLFKIYLAITGLCAL